MIVDRWRDDLCRAARGALRAKGFTGVAVLTLALGLAGATVMFALIHGVLRRPLPVREQTRLLVAWKEFPSGTFAHWPFRSADLDTIGRDSRVFERVAGASYYGAAPVVVVENGSASYIDGASVTGAFFQVLGVEPVLGRALHEADDVTGAENVLVISHGLWQRRYGGSRDVIGRRLTIGDRPFTIVGVIPPDVAYPRGAETWMTLTGDASTQTNLAFREGILRDVDLVARLRPGVTLEQARDELERLLPGLEAGAPPDAPRGLRPVVRRYEDVLVGEVRPALLILFAAVGLVLLIASANVANLLLLRNQARRSELAVRAALGASRGSLARQLIAESLTLALPAGLLGLAVTPWLLQVPVALVPGGLPRVESVRIDLAVVLFTLVVSLIAAVLAGVTPALFATRVDIASELRGGRQPGGGARARGGRRVLVVAQVALAVLIVAAAGLMTRSLLRLQAADMGLAADRLVFVDLGLLGTHDPEPEQRLQLLNELVARLEAAPGIEGATPVNTPPYAGTGGWDLPVFTAEGQTPDRAEKNPSLNLEAVHPNYFATFQVPLVRGRAFSDDDRSGAPAVAIVSADVAARTWPGEDPIGKRLKFGRPGSKEPWRTVVGVVRPTRYRELAEPRPTLYVPAPQFMVSAHLLALRTTLEPPVAARLARACVHAVDPDVKVTRVATFEELLAGPLARPRFNAFLSGVFGMTGLLLAAVGVYAVMAAHVRQRSPEIGVRVALGARPWQVRRLVLGEAMRLAGLGIAIGLAGTVAAGRVLRGLLFGVHPLDPASTLGAALLLVGASALACYLPLRWATKVDPLVVLRTN